MVHPIRFAGTGTSEIKLQGHIKSSVSGLTAEIYQSLALFLPDASSYA